jgi:hypothetical protein
VQLHIVDAPSVGNCRPEAQARNLEIPGSLALLAPRNDGKLLFRPSIGVIVSFARRRVARR